MITPKKETVFWYFLGLNLLLFVPFTVIMAIVLLIVQEIIAIPYDFPISRLARVIVTNTAWIGAMLLTMRLFAKRRKITRKLADTIGKRYITIVMLPAVIEIWWIIRHATVNDLIINIPFFLVIILGALTIWYIAEVLLYKRVKQRSSIYDEVENLTLAIYYLDPSCPTPSPVSESELMNGYEYKIIIDGESLSRHVDLISQISSIDLKPVEKESTVNVRLMYVFENNFGEEMLRVSMWGDNNSIFVNGNEVRGKPDFYEVIMPFLPVDMAQVLRKRIQHGSPAQPDVVNQPDTALSCPVVPKVIKYKQEDKKEDIVKAHGVSEMDPIVPITEVNIYGQEFEIAGIIAPPTEAEIKKIIKLKNRRIFIIKTILIIIIIPTTIFCLNWFFRDADIAAGNIFNSLEEAVGFIILGSLLMTSAFLYFRKAKDKRDAKMKMQLMDLEGNVFATRCIGKLSDENVPERFSLIHGRAKTFHFLCYTEMFGDKSFVTFYNKKHHVLTNVGDEVLLVKLGTQDKSGYDKVAYSRYALNM